MGVIWLLMERCVLVCSFDGESWGSGEVFWVFYDVMSRFNAEKCNVQKCCVRNSFSGENIRIVKLGIHI